MNACALQLTQEEYPKLLWYRRTDLTFGGSFSMVAYGAH